MPWAEAVPNLLIGLREGLEAGLVVTILLAALRKITPDTGGRVPSAPVWLGVLGAVMVAGSFAAVLTFAADVLPSRAQEAVSGLLSVLAVGLVTGMVFWMRRAAAGLSAQLRGEVQRAAAIGAGALTVTAFLAVGREGLETTLFLWTAARASGSTAGPLAGAALGLAAAVLLCWLLYRRAVRLNIGVFFSRTAILLIIIAAGVLAAGLGDLQTAGLLPGQHWIAFDLSAHADPNSWWVSIITGATELSPAMTVLQVVAWVSYLAVVIPLFLHAGQAAAPEKPKPSTLNASAPGWERLAARRPWAIAAGLVVVPALAAGAVIVALPSSTAAGTTSVTVTGTGCARDWTAAQSGTWTFTVRNQSGKAGEINLVTTAGGVVGEIETLGPATSAQLTATLSPGSYVFKCFLSGQAVTSSAPVQVTGQVTGHAAQPAPAAVKPVTLRDLTGPNQAYQRYAAAQLRDLASAVAKIQADLRRGDLAAARTGWLAAQLAWERTGASYNSFGDDGTAVDGLPAGVADKDFTGLHRLEYGLWHGQNAAQLRPVAATLAAGVAQVQRNLDSAELAGDPTNLPVRAHEILEDALRDHLSGLDDQGSGAAYPQTYADLQVTRAVLGELSGLISARAPGLMGTLNNQLNTLRHALLATQTSGHWTPADAVPLAQRQAVNGATGALLESLSAVPDLLEVPPSH